MTVRLNDVFGVQPDPILSYIERKNIDDRFSQALGSKKQIIVYGSSKQGKTALVKRHLSYNEHIVVHVTPKTDIQDIYKSILRQLNVAVVSSTQQSTGSEGKISVGAKFKALIPLLGSSTASIDSTLTGKSDTKIEYKEVEFNLELPQDVYELTRDLIGNKFIIIENFHYLTEDKQKQFSFDLRNFQDLGLRFIILGVWREKNRLAQFNGDLLDRIEEIEVEPWENDDFKRIVTQGQAYLNIIISIDLIEEIADNSFGSVGVFQELVKEICIIAKIDEKLQISRVIVDLDILVRAIEKKAEDYATRHVRALEAIATGRKPSTNKELLPLILPFYLVKVLLSSEMSQIKSGLKRSYLQDKIKEIHHRPDDVRPSDMSFLLYNLDALQNEKNIAPPILDFDRSTNTLRVVDSTFFFFFNNANQEELTDLIQCPVRLE